MELNTSRPKCIWFLYESVGRAGDSHLRGDIQGVGVRIYDRYLVTGKVIEELIIE